MSAQGFIRLIVYTIGISIVIIIGIVLRFYTQNWVQAKDAQVQAELKQIGVDYAGTVEKVHINEGESVTKGEVIFTIQSNTLQQQIKDNRIDPDNLSYEVNDDNDIILKSSATGKVSKIKYSQGEFVQANSILAYIKPQDSVFFVSEFSLGEHQIQRLQNNSSVRVKFPNGTKIDTYITDITYIDKENSSNTSNTDEQKIAIQSKAQPRFNQRRLVQWSEGTPVKSKLVIYPEKSVFQPIKDRVTFLK